jgi:hypothetical protein
LVYRAERGIPIATKIIALSFASFACLRSSGSTRPFFAGSVLSGFAARRGCWNSYFKVLILYRAICPAPTRKHRAFSLLLGVDDEAEIGLEL